MRSYALKNVDRAQWILRAWIIIIKGGLISLFSGICDIHLLLFERLWRIHLLHPPRFDRIKVSAMFAWGILTARCSFHPGHLMDMFPDLPSIPSPQVPLLL